MFMRNNAVLFFCCMAATHLLGVAAEDASDGLSTYEILMRVFDATRGLRWTDHTGWLRDDDVCTWYGVTCYEENDEELAGNVQTLDLSSNRLVGTLPREVFSLPYMESLLLSDNPDLEISLGDIVECPYLAHIQISETSVVSLEGIGAAKNLETLRMVRSQLEGTLPSSLFSLTKLSGLFANYNAISGTIPTLIGLMTQLQQLFLYGNKLSGQIPTEIGLLHEASILTLTDNRFNGTLPIALGHMSSMQRLAINQVDGQPGITGTLPKFSALKHLTELYLENQLLTGSIPDKFMFNAPKDEIVKISLSNNLLTGALPPSWSDFYRLRPNVQGNKITEVDKSLCQNDWFSGDTCPDKILCPIGTYSTMGRATPSDPCVACDSAKYFGSTLCLDVGGNETSTPSTEREILEHFYKQMDGENWKIRDGWFEGDDVCKWHGVDCDEEGSKVIGLSMLNNGLGDTFPSEVFSLPSLRGLNLGSNDIEFSFQGIDKATKLEVLDLSNVNLKSLDGIGDLTQTELIKLKIASNDLMGEIPLAIFSLTNLVDIDLSHNQFSGRLPSDVGKLSLLEHISASGNELRGPLPTELGSLTGLETLDLSENDFTGSLPTQLEQLTWLGSLSLHQTTSVNGFSGGLPAFANLKKLTSLHLESNKLTGPLPSNFLANTDDIAKIEVRLNDNQFEGVVPSSWANRFDNLFIDLTGNLIVGLTDSWCQNDDWMDGLVNEFGCDAILCPAGTFNEYGRQTGADLACISCPQSGNLLGSRVCQGQGQIDIDTSSLILTEFYHATGGDSWANRTGWIQSADHCTGWKGVTCNEDGDVLKLELPENGLMGTLTSNLFKLPALKELDLRGNHELSISFEGIGQASNLDFLSLRDVNLDSIVGIGDARDLRDLHLSGNELSGTIPDELFELTKLTYLNLDSNKFTGRLPSGVANLISLESLFLVNNRISGQIPAVIGNLANLKALHLTSNRISGTLPSELEELTALEMLALEQESGKVLTGDEQSQEGPDSAQIRSGIRGPLLAFRSNPNLKYLFLSDNSLTGTVPFDFLNGILDKTKPIYVDISLNALEGTLPASLSQFDVMEFLAGGNRITGIAPGLCLKEEWQKGLVGDFGCKAILCPPGTYNSHGLHYQGFGKDTGDCEKCDVDGATSFYGSMECWSPGEVQISEERDILKQFFNDLGGFDWKINTNWLDDSSSLCSWFGVTCVSDDDNSIQSLHLPSNGLNGTVPVSIFKLKNLTEIDLSGNTISIDFNNVSEASSVTYLNLHDTGILSLSGIASAAPGIELLHIERNNLNSLPQEIFDLESLSALYMSQNKFTGIFPTELTQLSNLVFLVCASCGFSGPLPSSIGLLTNLEFFSMYSNNLNGTIPSEIGSLTNLKHLDLSFQSSAGGKGFSGTLPDLALLVDISEIFLARNSLTGSIPSTMLDSAVTTEHIILDLKDNVLTGEIPSELSRFAKMELLLANNKIEGVPASVCAQTWNNGLPAYSDNGCDHVLCAKGSYNNFGHAAKGVPCLECQEVNGTLYFGSTSCGEDLEQSILTQLYADLNGRDWTLSDGWLTDNNVCNWYGITCHDTGTMKGHVREIVLPENNMVGTASSDVYKLAYLESLEIAKNEVLLPFSGINGANNLVNLHISDTLVDSLSGIAAAAKLEYLHVTECNITGSIPDEMYTMTSLKGLYMNYNQFGGIISTLIGQLSNLEELYFFNNELSGSVPSEIGLLSDMAVLGLGQNKLTGTLPSELGMLTKMEVLSLQLEVGLSGNKDGGLKRGLGGPLLPFDNFPVLRELYLGKNSFTGTIPTSFLSGVTNTSRTARVDLTNNLLLGSIPSGLARFNDLRLFLAGNKIDHVPDELCEKHDWMEGLMDSGCDALLCSPGFYSEYGRRISDREPCQPCAFNASSFFYGSQSCSPQDGDYLDERSILFQLYRALDGDNWKNRDNWLEDNRSICKWHGVHCSSDDSIAADESVERLELPSNGLKGTIPEVIYHLSSLQVVNVRGNDIALSFHGAEVTSSLQELYLDQTKIGSLDGIGNIAPLKILHLNDNDQGGNSLPEDLFDLTNLQMLDLSNSGFAGTLSEKVGQLTNLRQLFGHKNDFSGTIPSSLGLLDKLEILQLSENMFYGELPYEMEGMTSMKSLFIDSFLRNGAGISGPLLSFSSMPLLRDLYLGSNTLTGFIPADFLSGTKPGSEVINVGLSGNSLTGTVPATLGTFEKLNIDLTDNLFEKIDNSLCDMSTWMGGDVKTYECDAIMCPLGTFNEQGRQTSDDNPCIPCTGSNVTTYMGSVKCLPLQKKQERQILELFFQVTGGKDWKEKGGWMDDDVDICEWKGISCRADMTVESVRLGSNNLVGKVPKQIFELSNLHFLWLYSNPIDFSFGGIEKAKKLTSLILDSTGLKSLEGIGNAVSLSDVDVRFNSLTSLPDEIRNLRELQSLSASNNQISGTVPLFGNNRKLRTLRLDNNKFKGTVPTFWAHEELASLDLSDNELTGTIPATLLQSLQNGAKPFIDLSSNELTGNVPGELANRFKEMTLYLKDNKIEGIDNEICLALGINHGDVHDYSCDAILCPPGKYGPGIGRASADQGECLGCSQTDYYGSSTCESSSALNSQKLAWTVVVSAIGALALLL